MSDEHDRSADEASEEDHADEGVPAEESPGEDDRTGPVPTGIEPSAPDEFGLVQVWWGTGKGKTTAALGMGMRAAGHGYRVHLLQFMKGGAGSVADVRGEYEAIAALPAFSYENAGHYGWHGFRDGTDDDEHAARAQAGLARARDLVEAAAEADLSVAVPLDRPADEGVHMLILDELLYAANRDLVDPTDVVALVEDAPEGLELVLTGGHERPDYVADRADLVSEVRKDRHPIDDGQSARQGTEY